MKTFKDPIINSLEMLEKNRVALLKLGHPSLMVAIPSFRQSELIGIEVDGVVYEVKVLACRVTRDGVFLSVVKEATDNV